MLSWQFVIKGYKLGSPRPIRLVAPVPHVAAGEDPQPKLHDDAHAVADSFFGGISRCTWCGKSKYTHDGTLAPGAVITYSAVYV